MYIAWGSVHNIVQILHTAFLVYCTYSLSCNDLGKTSDEALGTILKQLPNLKNLAW